jgi:5'-nucleotidase
MMLAHQLPPDVDILKVDVPSDATLDTSWRVTRASRQSYYVPIPRPTPTEDGRLEVDYKVQIDVNTLEPDSDIQALAVDRVVSVCPLSIDMTSRVDTSVLAAMLRERQPVASD